MSVREIQREKLGAEMQITLLRTFGAKSSKETELESFVKVKDFCFKMS